MHRYVLFAGNQYYPQGGINDYRASAPGRQELRSLIAWTTFPAPGSIFDEASGAWRDPDPDGEPPLREYDILFTIKGTDDTYSWYHLVDFGSPEAKGKPVVLEAYSSYAYFAAPDDILVVRELRSTDIWASPAGAPFSANLGEQK